MVQNLSHRPLGRTAAKAAQTDLQYTPSAAPQAITIASRVAAPGAAFVGKVFMGEGFDAALSKTKAIFQRTKIVKPEASRKASMEIYVVGTDKRATPLSGT